MRHHGYNPNFPFVIQPENFNKYSDRELLQYCLGATMYMPGTKDFTRKLVADFIPGLTTTVFCFEDACPESQVPLAEQNVLRTFDYVNEAIDAGTITINDLPLIFCRVRNADQFRRFASMLDKRRVRVLAGINFPKFNSQNGEEYFDVLKELNDKFGEVLYGMPIIEDPRVAFKETRYQELLAIRDIMDKRRDLSLQIRVGATDFSSCFGVRRGVDYSIYDVMTVSECLCDILNVFGRNNDYVVSGPVWEYFRASKKMMFDDLPQSRLEDCLLKRIPIVNAEVDGLLREVILDRANGFVGRTVIHPTHIKYVNALQAVTLEEYNDALQILGNSDGGVCKGEKSNKMNEVKPHTNWANKIRMRARAFGVVENEKSYLDLIGSVAQ